LGRRRVGDEGGGIEEVGRLEEEGWRRRVGGGGLEEEGWRRRVIGGGC
jgi:hypothetical protein